MRVSFRIWKRLRCTSRQFKHVESGQNDMNLNRANRYKQMIDWFIEMGTLATREWRPYKDGASCGLLHSFGVTLVPENLGHIARKLKKLKAWKPAVDISSHLASHIKTTKHRRLLSSPSTNTNIIPWSPLSLSIYLPLSPIIYQPRILLLQNNIIPKMEGSSMQTVRVEWLPSEDWVLTSLK